MKNNLAIFFIAGIAILAGCVGQTPQNMTAQQTPTEQTTPPVEQPQTQTPMETQPTPTAPTVQAYTMEADDANFYTNGQATSTISVSSGDMVKITLTLRRTGVSFGGLDFRGPAFGINTGRVAPGETTNLEFTPAQSGTITGYWPSTNFPKSKLQVNIA